MTLEEFLNQERKKLNSFENYWREMNRDDPDAFPLELPTDNEGLWGEMFDMYDPEGKGR